MSYKIVSTPEFEKEIKRLSGKYPSIRNDFAQFLDELSTNPEQGTSLGIHCYKIRFAIKSKGKGKSGGGQGNYLRESCSGNCDPGKVFMISLREQ